MSALSFVANPDEVQRVYCASAEVQAALREIRGPGWPIVHAQASSVAADPAVMHLVTAPWFWLPVDAMSIVQRAADHLQSPIARLQRGPLTGSAAWQALVTVPGLARKHGDYNSLVRERATARLAAIAVLSAALAGDFSAEP